MEFDYDKATRDEWYARMAAGEEVALDVVSAQRTARSWPEFVRTGIWTPQP